MIKEKLMKIKNIAILTSGGDAPGMNTAIYGVFSACQNKGINLYGIRNGYDGLIDDDITLLTYDILEGRINQGGTLLKSKRSKRFFQSKYIKIAVENLKKHLIDALIIVGGDGSLKGAMELRDRGIKVLCLPGTIDNDLNFFRTIGYDSALNSIVSAVDQIQDSLSAFNNGAVVKIMGRVCTDLIDGVAKAIHTDFVIKDPNYSLAQLIKKIKAQNDGAHLPPVVLVLEDTVDSVELAKILQNKCNIQVRPHIIGYIQRGGSPSAFDRMYAYDAGKYAVDLIADGKAGLVVGIDDLQHLVTKAIENSINYDKIS